MEPEMEEDDQNSTIDPEVWLQSILTINSNSARRDKLIQRMSEKSGVHPEKVEEVLQALLKILMEQTGRAN